MGQYPGCVDALQNAGLGASTGRDGFVSILKVLHAFIRPEVAENWYSALRKVVSEHGADISRKPNSPADSKPERYKTAQFFRGPCTCKYDYAGTSFHRPFSYRNGEDLGPAVLGDIEDPLGKRPIGRERGGGLKVAWILNFL